jgi:hypothetical protein
MPKVHTVVRYLHRGRHILQEALLIVPLGFLILFLVNDFRSFAQYSRGVFSSLQ